MITITSQNRDSLRFHRAAKKVRVINLGPGDVAARIYLPDNRFRKVEPGYGTSFLSASGHSVLVPPNTGKVVITDFSGKERMVTGPVK
jgi:hypothetical protein